MTDVILVALISFGGTAIGSASAVLAANRLSNYRIDQLEKKVEANNRVQTRMLTAEINIRCLGAATGVEIINPKGE